MSRAFVKKIMLINPPYEEVCHVPFSTLPALTAVLRKNHYDVVQRDLNLETVISLMETPFLIDNIIELFASEIGLLKNANISKDIIHTYEKQRNYLKYAKSSSKKLLKRYREELSVSTKTRLTKILINDVYSNIVHSIEMLSRLAISQECYLNNVQNKKNFFYRIFRDFVSSINWDEFMLVGVTMGNHSRIIPSLILANMIKEKNKDIHIIVGGDLFSTDTDLEDTMDQADIRKILGFVDSIALYEGESTLLELANALKKNEHWKDISNLVYLNGDKLCVNKPFRMENIEELNMPDYDGLPVEYYPGLSIEISRGCYHNKCAFCRQCETYHKPKDFSSPKKYYRQIPIDQVIATIKKLKSEYQKDYFVLSSISFSPDQIMKLSSAIIKAKLNIKWIGRVRLDKAFGPEHLEIMAKSGCSFYHFSPESFCQEVIGLMNKKIDVEHIKSLLKYWNDHRHRLPPCTLNVFTGFPGETLEQFLETYDFIKTAKCDVGRIHLYRFTKHSDVYYHPEKYGIEVLRKRDGGEYFLNHAFINWNGEQKINRELIESFLQRKQSIFTKRKNVNPWIFYKYNRSVEKKLLRRKFEYYLLKREPVYFVKHVYKTIGNYFAAQR